MGGVSSSILHCIRILLIEDAAAVFVSRSGIGGSIQVVQGASAWIDLSRVNADILFDANNRGVAATRNSIGGDLQAFQNTGGVYVAGKRIDGNLQCKTNNPPPAGGGNVVQGNKEDQCAGL